MQQQDARAVSGAAVESAGRGRSVALCPDELTVHRQCTVSTAVMPAVPADETSGCDRFCSDLARSLTHSLSRSLPPADPEHLQVRRGARLVRHAAGDLRHHALRAHRHHRRRWALRARLSLHWQAYSAPPSTDRTHGSLDGPSHYMTVWGYTSSAGQTRRDCSTAPHLLSAV